jgi:hypothetical protein
VSFSPLLYEELCVIDQRIQAMEERIQRMFRANEQCQKIAAVEGVGPLIATAMVAAVSDGKVFRSGRHPMDGRKHNPDEFAAWLGQVPRQHSSGDNSGSQRWENGSPESMDCQHATEDRDYKSLCRRSEQERTNNLDVACDGQT